MKRKKRVKIIFLCLFCIVFVIICPRGKLDERKLRLNLVETADIVLFKGESIQGKLVQAINFSSLNYSHIGVIKRKGDEINVLHATPSKIDAGNGIRYENLKTVLLESKVSDIKVLRYSEMNCAIKEAICDKLNQYIGRYYPFDYRFDNCEMDKLYCSELVYHIFDSLDIFRPIFDLNHPIKPNDFLEVTSLREVNIY